jgi:AcrR family transcriptional regulator
MAQSRPRGGGRRPPEISADPDRIIDATLAAIATQGWRSLSLAAIAVAAELSILQVYRIFPSKAAILCGLYRRIDEAVLAMPLDADPDERPRDRVFDLLMRRFDALAPYKPAFRVLRRELPADPPSALVAAAALLRSMRLSLEAAEIPVTGICGIITVKLVAANYLASARVWLSDDSPDLAPTMVALDRRLRGIERWLVRGRGEPRRTAEA